MVENYRQCCPVCHGKGVKSGPLDLLRTICPKCEGRGYIEPANVIAAPIYTTADIPPDKVLTGAIGQLKEVVVVGVTTDGFEYFAVSSSDGSSVLWNLEKAKMTLLGIARVTRGNSRD